MLGTFVQQGHGRFEGRNGCIFRATDKVEVTCDGAYDQDKCACLK